MPSSVDSSPKKTHAYEREKKSVHLYSMDIRQTVTSKVTHTHIVVNGVTVNLHDLNMCVCVCFNKKKYQCYLVNVGKLIYAHNLILCGETKNQLLLTLRDDIIVRKKTIQITRWFKCVAFIIDLWIEIKSIHCPIADMINDFN